MYTPLLSTSIVPVKDQTYLDTIQDASVKALYRDLIISVIDTNGSAATITPGIGKQFIDPHQFFHIVDFKTLLNQEGSNFTLLQTYERALNWKACGEGKGGLAGAAIREVYREKVDLSREAILVTDPPAAHGNLLKEFLADMELYKSVFSFWKANADNVIALSAAVMLKEGHHWDAQNQRPQRALLAALDQKDVFPDNDMRKLFYLAVHPLPLRELMLFVTDSARHLKLNEAVRCRLKAPPAGTAGFVIAATGGMNLMKEEFFKYASEGFKADLATLSDAVEDIHSDPLRYHTMSSLFTGNPKTDIPAVSTECLALCIAYIKTCVKGSLASAPSLNKLAEQNARLVQKYASALDKYVETRGADIAEMISAGAASYKKIERIERNEEMVADAKARAEIQAAAAAAAAVVAVPPVI